MKWPSISVQQATWVHRIPEKLRLRDYSPVGERRAAEQKPFAAIITCAGSRISPELVFDVERGNLFVSRIAGNSIDQGGVTEGTTYPASKYGAIGDFVDLLTPTVKSLPADERTLTRCVPANAIAQAQDLAHRGPIIAPAVAESKIQIVAGVYNIANGAVSVVE